MNTEIEVTDWFPHDVNPVHAGDYEVEFCAGIYGPPTLAHWDGHRFICGPDDNLYLLPGDQWRGVKREIDPIDEFLS